MAGITKTIRRKIIRTCLRKISSLTNISSLASVPASRVLVISPHPDDETFGCGGTIALLRQANIPVSIIFCTRGEASHQNCCQTPASQIASLRTALAVHAGSHLGINPDDIHWLDFEDGNIPNENQPAFSSAVERLRHLLDRLDPQILFLPQELDGLADHANTAKITMTAWKTRKQGCLLSYPVWMWHRLKVRKLPQVIIGRQTIRVDISNVLNLKKSAMNLYLNTLNPLCHKPCSGILPIHFESYFSYPYELFFRMESQDHPSRSSPADTDSPYRK
jgi:LmbE family N-acetylglucosaminyl deacetylase